MEVATSTPVGVSPRREVRSPSMDDTAAVLNKLSSSAAGNMFVNHTWHIGCGLLMVKYIIIGCTLLPIRVAFLLLGMAFTSVFSCLASIGLTNEASARRLSWWRRVFLLCTRLCVRWCLFALGYHWIVINGRMATKQEAAFLVPNHITFVDPTFLTAYCGAAPVSAEENKKLPVVGPMLRSFQAVFVQRERSAAASGDAAPPVAPPPVLRSPASDAASTPAAAAGVALLPSTSDAPAPVTAHTAVPVTAAAGAQAAISSRAADPTFPQILIFPEGFCTNGDAVISFKTGAFVPGLPVQPVAVRYKFKYFDPSWPAASPSPYELIFRMMCQFHNSMEITFLPVYHPSPEERANPRLFATNVQHVLARHLGVRTTQHSFEDAVLASIAAKARYPVTQAVVEFQTLRSALKVNARSAGALLQRFIAADATRRGRIAFDQFAELLAPAGRWVVHHNAPGNASAPIPPTLPTQEDGTIMRDRDDSRTTLPTLLRASSGAADSVGRGLGERVDAFAASLPFSNVDLSPVLLTRDGAVVGSKQELERLFRMLDLDEDGELSYRELLVGLAVINNQTVSSSSDALRVAFRILDADDDGRIPRDDFLNLLQRIWPSITPDQMHAIFEQADVDGDGQIRCQEFVNWAAAHPESLPLFQTPVLRDVFASKR